MVTHDGCATQQPRERRVPPRACAHVTVFAALAGATIFGAAMDSRHDSNVYKIVTLTGAVLASAHAAWWAGVMACDALVRKWDFLLLYADDMRRGVSFVTFSACAFACIRAVSSTAAAAAGSRGVLSRVVSTFDSLLVLCTCFLALQSVAVALFTYVFFTHRRSVWSALTTDDATLLSHPSLTRAFACLDIASGLTLDAGLGQFLRRWVDTSDAAITGALPRQTELLYGALRSLVRPRDGSMITRDEFTRLVASQSPRRAADQGVESLWRRLSTGCHETAGAAITRASVERMLYEIAFRRKRFAHQVLTDHMCVSWVMWDLGLLLYPFGALVIAQLWGYTDVFGEGFDMFKTYVLAVSFISAQLRERVMFMVTMTVRRPYDIGDVLLVDGLPFRVHNFTPSHTYVVGNTARSLHNSVLIKDTVINLTRAPTADEVRLALPITASNECARRARRALEDFACAKPDVVDAASVRVGWAGVEEGVKLLACAWRYSFEVHDVVRYNSTRTLVADHVVQALERDVALAGLGFVAAQGGAFNSSPGMCDYIKAVETGAGEHL